MRTESTHFDSLLLVPEGCSSLYIDNDRSSQRRFLIGKCKPSKAVAYRSTVPSFNTRLICCRLLVGLSLHLNWNEVLGGLKYSIRPVKPTNPFSGSQSSVSTSSSRCRVPGRGVFSSFCGFFLSLSTFSQSRASSLQGYDGHEGGRVHTNRSAGDRR